MKKCVSVYFVPGYDRCGLDTGHQAGHAIINIKAPFATPSPLSSFKRFTFSEFRKSPAIQAHLIFPRRRFREGLLDLRLENGRIVSTMVAWP
jgi:hypothetical protein